MCRGNERGTRSTEYGSCDTLKCQSLDLSQTMKAKNITLIVAWSAFVVFWGIYCALHSYNLFCEIVIIYFLWWLHILTQKIASYLKYYLCFADKKPLSPRPKWVFVHSSCCVIKKHYVLISGVARVPPGPWPPLNFQNCGIKMRYLYQNSKIGLDEGFASALQSIFKTTFKLHNIQHKNIRKTLVSSRFLAENNLIENCWAFEAEIFL